MNPRFFVPSPLTAGRAIALPSAAAHHAARVLRLKLGDAVTLFDGEGGEYGAEIRSVTSRVVDVVVTERRAVERESPLEVTFVQALIAADRMDYAIQKAVELGASAIAPVATARGVARLEGERARRRVEHWRAIAIAACEQCGRNRVPEVRAPMELGAWLRQPSSAERRLVLAPAAEESLANIAPGRKIELLVGPEGGFAPEEALAAAAAGFRAVRLGPRILRAETAGPATLAALHALWGDWR
ncbi:MAG TPA: 16S rRNA (uracil(1498)-N(3))-methyltransferase [Casimicrobiaceae bacterium]|nr:16S rRNA (uracil(1498)-N(3))-methyltransferase [Casimicrobiaceae bacterium]